MCAYVLSCSVMSNSLQPHGLQPARLFCPWGSPDKNIRMGCHTLLQGIFPTQGLNPGLPYCRQILYHLSHQGSSRIGVCSLSLLQGIFLSQELNWSLLHCRGIICQLSYQGSPFLFYILKYFSNFSLSPYSDCTFFSWISAFHIWSLSLCFSLDPDLMTHCTCMVLNSPSAFESFFDSQYICTVWWKDDIAKRKELSYSYNTNEALTEFWHNLSFLYPVYPIKV